MSMRRIQCVYGVMRVMCMRGKSIFFFILTIAWMLLIFMLSHRPGSESQQDSFSIGMLFCEIFVPSFEDMSPDEQMELALKLDHPIRKLAHFTEYFILAVLLVGAVDSRDRKRSLRLLIPWAIAAFYAATDEIHQFFIPGRNCNVGDVLIDSAGAFVGVLLSVLIVDAVGRRRCRKDME